MSGSGTGVPLAATSDIARVRLNIGDVDSTSYYLSDDQILMYLSDASNNVILASIYAVEALVAIFGMKVTKAIGDQRIAYSDLQEHFIKVSERLQHRLENPIGDIPIPSSGTTTTGSIFHKNLFSMPGNESVEVSDE